MNEEQLEILATKVMKWKILPFNNKIKNTYWYKDDKGGVEFPKGHLLYGGKWLPGFKTTHWHPDTNLNHALELLEKFNIFYSTIQLKNEVLLYKGIKEATWVLWDWTIVDSVGDPSYSNLENLPSEICKIIFNKIKGIEN